MAACFHIQTVIRLDNHQIRTFFQRLEERFASLDAEFFAGVLLARIME